MAATAASEVCTDFPDADQPRLDTLSADAHAAIAQQLATAADVLSLACVSGSLSASLAHELAPYGVTANALSPGLIDTVRGATAGALPPSMQKVSNLLGRKGKPEEIAAIIAYIRETFQAGPAYSQ